VARESLRVCDTSGSVKKWLLLVEVWELVRCFNGIAGDGEGGSEIVSLASTLVPEKYP